jgi:hypothetical protein
MPGKFSFLQGAASYIRGSGTAQGAIYGGIAGSMYGGMSDTTSIVGGAAMGAGIGAGIARYGASGIRRASLGQRGIGVSRPGPTGAAMGFMMGVRNRAMMDVRGARMTTNQGMNKIRSSLKGWLG